MHGFHFAIVGAGIAGASLAARLAAHGRVLLLERESQPGLHSTGRSAASFMETYGSPQGRALTRASRATYAAPAVLPVLTPRGCLYPAWQGQEAAFEALAAPGLVRETAAQALARVPVLRAEGLLGAWYEADAMDIDVDVLLQGLLRSARAGGAELWTGAELVSARRGDDGWQLRLADGRGLHAGVIVDAAGAWADRVAQAAGLPPLGLQPCRRSAFTFDAPPGGAHRAWPGVVAADESFYFKPDAGALLGSPANADPVEPHDVVPEELDIAEAIARITRHTTLAIRRPRRTWAGLRTFAPDGEMVVGWEPATSGFFWLAGHGGWGIQSAAGTALLAESLLAGLPLPEALVREGVNPAALAPDRLR